MNRKFIMTDEMLDELRRLYPTTVSSELSNRFNCTLSTIYYWAGKIGVKKTKEFISETARERTLDPSHGGRRSQFEKGQSPFNKGKKQEEYMSPESLELTKATRFKKGSKPANTKPIGYERVNVDGYREVKVRDVKGRYNFELKHREVWREHNGTVPKGYNVQFKDGNRLNCDIENLYLISRADQVSKENSIQRYPDELKRAMRLTSKLRKKIKQYEQTDKY